MVESTKGFSNQGRMGMEPMGMVQDERQMEEDKRQIEQKKANERGMQRKPKGTRTKEKDPRPKDQAPKHKGQRTNGQMTNDNKVWGRLETVLTLRRFLKVSSRVTSAA